MGWQDTLGRISGQLGLGGGGTTGLAGNFVSSGVSGITAAGGAALSYYGQREANRRMEREANSARRFALDFRRSQYPEMVQSLRDAGLNPLLAVGASPGGASFAPVPSQGNPGAGLGGELGQSARATARIGRELGILGNQEKQSREAAQAEKLRTDALGMDPAQKPKTLAEKELIHRIGQMYAGSLASSASAQNFKTNTRLLESQIRLTNTRARLEALGIPAAQAQADLWSTVGGTGAGVAAFGRLGANLLPTRAGFAAAKAIIRRQNDILQRSK